MTEKIELENINHPGRVTRVDADKYRAMREAMLAVLPDKPPGLAYDEAIVAVRSRLPETNFPGGKTSGWWFKAVQLDLEAKGIVARGAIRPLRWYRTGKSI
jgi:hypothetical protein